jgi:hypothetical protein
MVVTPALLPLEEAVNEIAQARQFSADMDRGSPFAFLVGAGISYPSVPLAAMIEAECSEIAKRRNVKPPPGNPNAMDRYSYWFGKAWPQRIQRQQYLQGLIEGKPISLANFRLAHLLFAKSVANLVITPNFDNLLSRALTTFGHDTVRVCDHPGTVERISPTSSDIQIVHVHGNHWSYDQANLTGELEKWAKPSDTSTSSMAQLLDSVFKEVSPLVVGYSGWEGDVIMNALNRRLKNTLGNKIYWFCYRHDGYNSLPEWLKFHPEVAFVVPPETVPSSRSATVPATTSGEGRSSEPAEAEAPVRSKPELASEASRRTDTLEAYAIFDKLIQELGADSPAIYEHPLEFFA